MREISTGIRQSTKEEAESDYPIFNATIWTTHEPLDHLQILVASLGEGGRRE